MKITLFSAWVLIAVAAFPDSSAGATAKPRETRGAQAVAERTTPVPLISPEEQQERRVDQAALDSQLQAIRKAQELLRKNKGTDREAQLLFKLGEAQRRAGLMQFRLAYGSAPEKGTTAAGPYRQTYARAAESFGELIRRFPGSRDIARALFLRARCYSESGRTEAARADYQDLVRKFPASPDAVPAYMSLAEIAMEKNEWANAADYLRAVEKAPDSPYYPHALYRLAWCHYNLKDVARALAYIERDIRYYGESGAGRSDEALRENALQDAALFFLDGYEQKLSNYDVQNAYAYFKRLDSGPALGKMIVRYARLLRAHGHVAALADWKTLILREEARRPESYEIIVIAYEDQLNKRQYGALVQTAHDLVAYRNPGSSPESVARAEKLLLDAAAQLQALISRNKEAEGVAVLTGSLAGIYDAFTKLVDEKDPRIPKVHYNLAESLFEIGHYEHATNHYRWVVEHAKDSASLPNASIRAIASRYELLNKRGMVPKDLKPRLIADAGSGKLDPLLAEWIDWVDTHFKGSRDVKGSKVGKGAMKDGGKDGKEGKDDSIDSFYFEASRCMYAHGDLTAALRRLREFALEYPKSKYATPSATLLVDTYVASNEWEKLDELATELLAVKEWKGTEFARKLYALAADADFKSVEAAYRAGDFKGAREKAEKFLAEYPESSRKADCLALAGHAALSEKDRGTALSYFGQLMRAAPGTEAAASALLAEAAIREAQFDFAAAGRSYRTYLATPPQLAKLKEGERAVLRRKVLAFAWLASESRQLKSALSDKYVCTPAMATECERYEALLLVERGSAGPETVGKAFARARRAPGEVRALWAALALQGARHLPFRDRHVAIRLFTKSWQQLDPLARAFVLPYVTQSIPRAIALNRRDIRAVAPLQAREAYLIRRMEAIREIENAGMDAARLPWARIRASVTNELADLYADSARAIVSLRGASPEMAEPFLKKSDLLRTKAFQLASASAIEAEAFDAIAQPYLHADPKRLATLVPKNPVPKADPLDPGQLRSLDPEGEWDAAPEKCDQARCDDLARSVKAQWYRAARMRRWNEATYLIQYAKEKKALAGTPLSLLEAYTLAGMGAQAEALAELARARSGMPDRTRRNVNRLLLGHYQNSLARENAGRLMEEMRRDGESVAGMAFGAAGTGG